LPPDQILSFAVKQPCFETISSVDANTMSLNVTGLSQPTIRKNRFYKINLSSDRKVDFTLTSTDISHFPLCKSLPLSNSIYSPDIHYNLCLYVWAFTGLLVHVAIGIGTRKEDPKVNLQLICLLPERIE